MTELWKRQSVQKDIDEAKGNGARMSKISQLLGLSGRTFQRWKTKENGDGRKLVKRTSAKALSEEEKQKIIEVCNQDEYKDMTPNKIVPILAEKGQYIASESTFYKVLREYNQLKHRSNTKEPRPKPQAKTLEATAPNQLLSWDITYLKTSVKGMFFFLYLFMDVYSRRIMGWRIEDEESSACAKDLVEQICKDNNLSDIMLHSDNGSPMKSGTMLATLQFLGVTASFSRPSVSNDNAYSESLFKTLKYRAGYPKSFETLEEARAWVGGFVNWYNTEHRHSAIKFVTPEQRHFELDKQVMEIRHQTYLAAKQKNPARWNRKTRDWSYVDKVTLSGSSQLIEAKKIA